MEFGIVANTYATQDVIFGEVTKTGAFNYGSPAVTIRNGPMSCCGIAEISGFYSSPFAGAGYLPKNQWEAKAAWLAGLYRNYRNPGHFIYIVTDEQLSNVLHRLLLEIGSKEVAVFPNLNHGPNKLHLHLFNIRDAVGKYIDDTGQPLPYKEPEKVPLTVVAKAEVVDELGPIEVVVKPKKRAAKTKEAKNEQL